MSKSADDSKSPLRLAVLSLNDLAQRLQTAVGLAEAAHHLLELDDDETRDSARYTLEEAVSQLRQIRDDAEVASRSEVQS